MIELKLTFRTVEEYFQFIQTLPTSHTVQLYRMPEFAQQLQQLYRDNREAAQAIIAEQKAIQDLRDQAKKEKAS